MQRHLPATLVATLALTTLFLVPSAAAQETARPWIHIHVTDQGEKAANVQVNLPLSVVEIGLSAAPDKVVEKGRLKLKNANLNVEDLRLMWQDLREVGDAEFVSVEDKDQHVRISRRGNTLHINVDDQTGQNEKVRIEIPIEVVDALFDGEGDELNLRGAIRRRGTQRGEIVRVDDGDKKIRIWIDETS